MANGQDGALLGDARYDELRPLMFSIAYRMLGSFSEAEDVVLRFHEALAREATIESPKDSLTSDGTW
jgi:hypothetical protein